MNWGKDCNGSDEQEAGEGHEVESSQGLWQPLIIARESAEPGSPGEGPFGNPPSRQQYKAAAGLGQLDNLQSDALRLGSGGGGIAGVALVNKGQFDMVAGHVLDRCGQIGDLGAVLLARSGDTRRQQMTQGIDRHMQFRPASSTRVGAWPRRSLPDGHFLEWIAGSGYPG